MIVASTGGIVALAVLLLVVIVVVPTWALAHEVGFLRALGMSLAILTVALTVTALLVACTFWAVK